MSGEAIPPISPDEAKVLIERERAIVVDVREAHEIARTGKIAGALHVPCGDIASLDLDRDTPIVLYCAAGVRSEIGGRILKVMGYRNVFNLGGFRNWVKKGGAVEKI